MELLDSVSPAVRWGRFRHMPVFTRHSDGSARVAEPALLCPPSGSTLTRELVGPRGEDPERGGAGSLLVSLSQHPSKWGGENLPATEGKEQGPPACHPQEALVP